MKQKPPIGVMPEKIWREQRIGDLHAAIGRYIAEGKFYCSVAEWSEELARHLDFMKWNPDSSSTNGL